MIKVYTRDDGTVKFSLGHEAIIEDGKLLIKYIPKAILKAAFAAGEWKFFLTEDKKDA